MAIDQEQSDRVIEALGEIIRTSIKDDDTIRDDFHDEFIRYPTDEELIYLVQRPHPLDEKTLISGQWDRLGFTPKAKVTLGVKNKDGIQPLTHKTGICPCATCGHETMLECEIDDCQCCSELCT